MAVGDIKHWNNLEIVKKTWSEYLGKGTLYKTVASKKDALNLAKNDGSTESPSNRHSR